MDDAYNRGVASTVTIHLSMVGDRVVDNVARLSPRPRQMEIAFLTDGRTLQFPANAILSTEYRRPTNFRPWNCCFLFFFPRVLWTEARKDNWRLIINGEFASSLLPLFLSLSLSLSLTLSSTEIRFEETFPVPLIAASYGASALRRKSPGEEIV